MVESEHEFQRLQHTGSGHQHKRIRFKRSRGNRNATAIASVCGGSTTLDHCDAVHQPRRRRWQSAVGYWRRCNGHPFSRTKEILKRKCIICDPWNPIQFEYQLLVFITSAAVVYFDDLLFAMFCTDSLRLRVRDVIQVCVNARSLLRTIGYDRIRSDRNCHFSDRLHSVGSFVRAEGAIRT